MLQARGDIAEPRVRRKIRRSPEFEGRERNGTNRYNAKRSRRRYRSSELFTRSYFRRRPRWRARGAKRRRTPIAEPEKLIRGNGSRMFQYDAVSAYFCQPPPLLTQSVVFLRLVNAPVVNSCKQLEHTWSFGSAKVSKYSGLSSAEGKRNNAADAGDSRRVSPATRAGY